MYTGQMLCKKLSSAFCSCCDPAIVLHICCTEMKAQSVYTFKPMVGARMDFCFCIWSTWSLASVILVTRRQMDLICNPFCVLEINTLDSYTASLNRKFPLCLQGPFCNLDNELTSIWLAAAGGRNSATVKQPILRLCVIPSISLP